MKPFYCPVAKTTQCTWKNKDNTCAIVDTGKHPIEKCIEAYWAFWGDADEDEKEKTHD